MTHARFPLLLILLASAGALGACDAAHASPVKATTRQSVLLELFTSEGCSSCPPAEAFLRALDPEQVPGVHVIALEYHVDYWDQLGWRDPFSLPEASARQQSYARVLGGGLFTPEFIVQGQKIVTGAERAKRMDWLSIGAERAASVTVTRADTRSGGGGSTTHVQLRVQGLPEAAHDTRDVLVVVSEAGLSSHVRSGENRGETLRHAPVVRRIVRVGEAPHADFDWRGDIKLDPNWNAAALRVIAFVQNRNGRQILAVGG